jgi:hypothetical protein
MSTEYFAMLAERSSQPTFLQIARSVMGIIALAILYLMYFSAFLHRRKQKMREENQSKKVYSIETQKTNRTGAPRNSQGHQRGKGQP